MTAAPPPVVYLVIGTDEYAIGLFLAEMAAKLGERSLAQMNFTRLSGRQDYFADLQNAALAAPFLASRRIVVVDNPLAQLRTKPAQDRFLELLGRLPASTALVLIESELKPDHWLARWARSQGSRVYQKDFPLPKGGAMAVYIRKLAADRGGTFSGEGAGVLSVFVGDDTRRAAQEVEKLLAYVNYARPVEADDVEAVEVVVPEVNVFAMVDAIGARDRRLALGGLHRLLEDDDPLQLFGMIVRQFRLLLQVKELQAASATEAEMAAALKTHPFVIRKVAGQTRNFTLADLDLVYRRLLQVDEQIKTGQSDPEAALEVLVGELTG